MSSFTNSDAIEEKTKLQIQNADANELNNVSSNSDILSERIGSEENIQCDSVKLSLDFFGKGVSEEDMKTVRKIFHDRETVTVKISQLLLNTCSGFSEELCSNMSKRTFGKWNQDFIWNNHTKYITDPILIEEINKLGLEESSERLPSIYLQKVPHALLSSISFHNENDGYERIEYNCYHEMRMLSNDKTIADLQEIPGVLSKANFPDSKGACDVGFRQRIIELDFLCIVFHILS